MIQMKAQVLNLKTLETQVPIGYLKKKKKKNPRLKFLVNLSSNFSNDANAFYKTGG